MIAFTFPGQGSQKPGMGEPWVGHPSWEIVREATEVAGRDLSRLLLSADAEELRATRNAQMATFLTALVALDAVVRLGIEPTAAAGHSLGEYTALVSAGAVNLEDGIQLVHERGEAMQEATTLHAGTMAAVLGLDDGQVEVACARVDGDVWVANYNAPGQVVIAGAPEAIEDAIRVARELGAKKVLPVEVSGAFHTPFMAPARDRLRKAIAAVDMRTPDMAVYANVDGRPHTDASEWASLLGAQLCNPVRWSQTLRNLADDGIATFVELGPGTILTGMARRTVKGSRVISVSTPDDLDGLLEALAGPAPEAAGPPVGEHLFVSERLVVSPVSGVFSPLEGIAAGTQITSGEVVGRVGGEDVRSPFTGTLMGVIAIQGERVDASQPIAWLRTGSADNPDDERAA